MDKEIPVGNAIVETKVEETTIKISFGVKRKETTKLIKTTTQVTEVAVDSDEEKDFEEQARQAKKRRLERFENGFAPKEEDEKEQKLVIPVVIENDWRVAKLLEKQKNGTITDEEKARLAILTEDKPFDFEMSTSVSNKHVIKIGGDEIAVAEDADYKHVPIEHFGLAVLRGCGWQEGAGIGRKPQVVPLQVNAQRPKGLGLGATPKPEGQKNKNGKQESEETSGEITRDSLVKVTNGRNSGKFGKVESRDDDNNSAFIRLALGGDTVKVSLFALEKVSKKEYERDGKCINKNAYDNAKAKIDKKREELDKEVKRKEKRRADDDEVVVIDAKEGPSRDSSNEIWIRPDLIVRFIDKDYLRGKLYKEKLRVVDVASPKEVTLEDDYGKSYYELNQKWMETVIPRNEGARIMIVRGKYKGEPAVMEKKDKHRDRITVRLIHQDNKIVNLDFDDVCLFQPKYEEDYDM